MENNNNEEFDTIRFSSEIDGQRVTAIVPKTNKLDDIMIIFEDNENPENVLITKLKDKFILAVAKIIINTKYKDINE